MINEKKNSMVCFAISPSMKSKITEIALGHEMTLSVFLREIISDTIKKEKNGRSE